MPRGLRLSSSPVMICRISSQGTIFTVGVVRCRRYGDWGSGKKPWSNKTVVNEIRDVLKLRMHLLPYLYTAFANYQLKGIPPFRAMILETGYIASGNEAATGQFHDVTNPYAEIKPIDKEDQYMFGPSILVAPFYEQKATKREVLLPPGNWYDFHTGKLAGNNQNITVTAKQTGNKIPLYVKEDAVIPMLTKSVNRIKDAYGHSLEVRLYGDKEGVFELYEDDGVSFDYEKGDYRIREISVMKVDGQFKLSEQVTVDNAEAMFGKIEKLKVMK
jgi:alpha-glucosidase (family GH31 glycosyl hydrolase)